MNGFVEEMLSGQKTIRAYGREQAVLEKFDDCYNELTDINEREIFSYAFKLGMRIAIEVLTSNVYDS